jgi:hypothetical protein
MQKDGPDTFSRRFFPAPLAVEGWGSDCDFDPAALYRLSRPDGC